ncbi:MAG: hypothetical protein SGI92_28430 [Bryobacteraceae bacterium]|nr:hypothetical protein [Bryobacteraceae bacterium]
MLGSLITFVLLVFSVHCMIFALNPGIADVRHAPVRAGKSASAVLPVASQLTSVQR